MYESEDNDLMVTAAALAHEIKGPLSLIKAKLQLMETDNAETGKYGLIYSQIEKINSILLEFIGLAKPREYKFEETDIRRILEKCLGGQKVLANALDVRFTWNFEPGDYVILGDGKKLETAFFNILQNAFEAVGPGGAIRIHGKAAKDRLIFRFADNGRGMSEPELKKLGMPFFTTKEKGSGLGVYMSKKIIEDNLGVFSAESQPGKGTRITVTLNRMKAK